jgi:hypothetical protein
MNEKAFHEARTLLVEPDEHRIGRGISLTSIKDVTWVHQRHAMIQGYNSVLEMAFDELAAELGELKGRVEALEAEIENGRMLGAGG